MQVQIYQHMPTTCVRLCLRSMSQRQPPLLHSHKPGSNGNSPYKTLLNQQSKQLWNHMGGPLFTAYWRAAQLQQQT
jgi:hypothetical protein